MPLKLIKLTLLQTNVQVKNVAFRGATCLGPLAGHVVGLLYGVGGTRTDGCGQSSLRGRGNGEKSRETDHCIWQLATIEAT